MKDITNTSTLAHIKANDSKQAGASLGQQVSVAAYEKNEIKDSGLTLGAIKKQNNNAILQANMQVSVSAGNESLSLLYKAAIEGINDQLKTEFGENAIQTVVDSELDVSPEATADRIVSLSTAFFSQYQEQNAEQSTEEAAKSFAEIITRGIDKGFSEAKDILAGLKVLEGGISDNIEMTYSLVQKGLQAFVDGFVSGDKGEGVKA